MDGRALHALLGRILGEAVIARHARLFGDLDAPAFPGGILGREALAVHALVADETLRAWLDAQLWSSRPSREALALGGVIDAALAKMPPARVRDGLVFFGHAAKRPEALARRYQPGEEAVLRGFVFATSDPAQASGGDLLFLVRSRSARPVWHLSTTARADEVLFPSHRRFLVEAVEMRAGKAAIVLSEDPAPGPFLLSMPERAALTAFFRAADAVSSSHGAGERRGP